MIRLFSLKNKLIGAAALLAAFSAFTAQAAPTVTIAATINGGEPASHGEFTVTSSEAARTVGGLIVTYEVQLTSTAIAGVDYQALSGTVNIPEGEITATIPVVVIDDLLIEVTKTVIVNLTSESDYNLGSPSAATVNITDDDDEPQQIDIKFCSDPNAFNCKKKGVLPVTIFGTDSFDVADIDINTLQLCTEDLSVCTEAPRNYSIADRGDPTSDLGAAQCYLLEVEEGIFEEQDYLNPDGFLDLDVAFEAVEVQDMLESFCDADKNAVSEPLVIIGLTFGGLDIYTVPIPNLGTDQLRKVNK